jgi:glycerol-1-phosphate dehydrogenase [NAD(P)+]
MRSTEPLEPGTSLMSDDILRDILNGTWVDPDGSGPVKVSTRIAVIEPGLVANAASLLAAAGFPSRVAVVMDPATRKAAGDTVLQSLQSGFATMTIELPQGFHPDMEVVDRITAEIGTAEAVVAVGSGSINDVSKFAATRLDFPYAVFGTAPSMNGYTSLNAAITEKNLKKSLSAKAPRAVYLDLDVLAEAPRRLIAAGFGDSMARATAQFDWLLSHLLLDTPYRTAPFVMLQKDEARIIDDAAKLVTGDRDALRALARVLLLSGFGMALAGSSSPASQGEHLIAHYMDMFGRDLPAAFHGEHIAVTTLTMARLQEDLLALPEPRLHASLDTLQHFEAALGAAVGRECWSATQAKRFDVDRTARLNDRLAAGWPEMRRALAGTMVPTARLSSALAAVGAPTRPADCGIPEAFYVEAVLNARLIRDRFTTLDLLAGMDRLAADLVTRDVGR